MATPDAASEQRRTLAANRAHSKGDGNFPTPKPPPTGRAAKPAARSTARPHKPPARELTRRKAATLSTGGGRLPPALRERFDREGTTKRAKGAGTGGTRTGSRTPKSGRWAAAVESQKSHRR